ETELAGREVVIAQAQAHGVRAVVDVPAAELLRRLRHGQIRFREGGGLDIGVHGAPVSGGTPAPPSRRSLAGMGWWQYVVAAGTVGIVALLGFLFTPRVGAQAVALLSLLAIAALALLVERGPALLAAAVSAAIWNYFFLPPIFAFRISHFEDGMLLGMYFLVALVLGQLTARLRAQQRNLLDALTRQVTLALDRQQLSELSEKAKLLAESERLGKLLLDSMSHEIRTPLTAIRAAAAGLAELKIAAGPGTQLIAEIQEAAERLNGLVGKVLDLTRLESGHIKPLFNECEVNDIVNVAVAETEKDLEGHKLTVDLPPGLPIIQTDFVFLQQALMNLLSNAALHTPAGTLVELRGWRTKEALVLAVRDHGPGIAPEYIGRIFDKFYRAPDAATGGTGLGLSLVKGFIEALGGTVAAENQSGGGLEFTITLPLNDADGCARVAI
ncbi:MAG TPA: ATP-binding protein, partial [Candidatus Saccharimonadales bacterium]|nr:ATP-binding protein [Candidatus Saccharimonadales bacterium]